MKQMFVVMKETYIRQVKSWSFLFMVLGPFLFLGLGVGIGYLTDSSTDAKNQVALVTEVPAVKESLKGTDSLTLDYKDEAAAKKAIKDEKAAAYLTVDEKDGQLEATYVGDQAMKTELKTLVAAKLSQVQQGINLARANLSKEQLTALSQQVSLKEKIDEKKEGLKMVQTMVAGGLGMLLYMILIFYSSITAQEVASEKGTKIMEVVFSSIKATDYFFARMLGLFGVIFTHIFVYVVGLVAVWIFRADIPVVKDILAPNSPITQHLAEAISLNTVFFIILGVFMYVVLSAFLGSTVARPEDSGKAISPLMMLVLFSFFGVTTLGSAGDVFLLKIGSYIPFISTFFMPFRTINGYATGLESWASLGIAVLFTIVGTVLIARIYASLILQTDDLGPWKTIKRALSYR
ncbi:ABC transporter permease [Streptococcus parasanguinis]|uniref:ABC transporter permease n=1 Tax=Streptococcus parasanguinis TaxID=1318 RepID=UPI001BD9FB10|nr:ABC transporter permease [Streptococcus parasanguinis]MBT0907738.1 ABC transporter permease [Streptococcus parasanguinis]